jgi:hypothetical protein
VSVQIIVLSHKEINITWSAKQVNINKAVGKVGIEETMAA